MYSVFFYGISLFRACKMGIMSSNNIEEATEDGSNVIPVKTGKRCKIGRENANQGATNLIRRGTGTNSMETIVYEFYA